MDENKEKASARVGIDYGIKLSYTIVDKSDAENKRDLLYSLLCFGCMFDDDFAAEPDPVVKKYNCLAAPEPAKIDLYELVHTTVTLPNATIELKTMWYLLFAYIILSEAPHDETLYKSLCSVLRTPEIFTQVLGSRYSVFIPPTVEELAAQGASSLLLDWYAPYIAYCAERDEHGATRETGECKRLLALGRFDDALLRSERLLSAFPDDEQVALVNIAARVSLSSTANKEERISFLKETLSVIDDYVDIAQTPYFRYYRGLTLLGLMDTVGARREFEICLTADPSFELAALMLKGMDKYEK